MGGLAELPGIIISAVFVGGAVNWLAGGMKRQFYAGAAWGAGAYIAVQTPMTLYWPGLPLWTAVLPIVSAFAASLFGNRWERRNDLKNLAEARARLERGFDSET